jgi:hypothetical protein
MNGVYRETSKLTEAYREGFKNRDGINPYIGTTKEWLDFEIGRDDSSYVQVDKGYQKEFDFMKSV